MDVDRNESRRSRYEDMEYSPVRRRRDDMDDLDIKDGGEEEGELTTTTVEKTGRHSSRDGDRKRAGGGEERDRERDRERNTEHRSKDRDRDYEKFKERERDRGKEKGSRDTKAKDKERRDRDKENEYKDREKERDREKDREKERDREKDREKERDREKDRDRVRGKEREKVNDIDRGRDRAKEKEKERVKNRGREKRDKEREREKEKTTKKGLENGATQIDHGEYDDKDNVSKKRNFFTEPDVQRVEDVATREPASTCELEERISKMKEERLKNETEESEILAWVHKSRKLEEKNNAEKTKAIQFSKLLEEQENIGLQEDSDNEQSEPRTTHDLAGAKILHGLEKVIEGGSVVLTLKDQDILADGDINNEVDMLENVEIGEQKRRNEAYRAAKKQNVYDDKFNNDFSAEKKILPQYDDPQEDEGVTLDERGRFTGEAERKLEELRRRLQGSSGSARFEDLASSIKTSSDYYTQEEMLKFKKPKKKKSLRKKEKLDIDALEAEAKSSGLGAGDLGSRNDLRRKALKEEEEKLAAEMRNNAYQSAYAKADEASKLLRVEQSRSTYAEKDENEVFADDDADLRKSLERARRLALKKQQEKGFGLQAIARLATSKSSKQEADDQTNGTEETQESRVVFTEVEEFVWGLQLDEDTHKPANDDVFKDEDEVPSPSGMVEEKEADGMEVSESDEADKLGDDDKEIGLNETLHEMPVGKGLSGVLNLLKERGALKESIEWGGRNMDKKKSKLVGIVNNDNAAADKFKDIRIERTDEFGRIMTPKEAFRRISHKFHGKGPGKMKQEKRMKQYQEELKLKQMKNSDTPSLSVERMREAQAQLKTPYLVLSGHAKSGHILDGSGFGTVEKDIPGSLTPMLGDKKVDYFLGIKRKAESGNASAPKRPRT